MRVFRPANLRANGSLRPRTRPRAPLRSYPVGSGRWSFARLRSKTSGRSPRVFDRHSDQGLQRGCIHSAQQSHPVSPRPHPLQVLFEHSRRLRAARWI